MKAVIVLGIDVVYGIVYPFFLTKHVYKMKK